MNNSVPTKLTNIANITAGVTIIRLAADDQIFSNKKCGKGWMTTNLLLRLTPSFDATQESTKEW